MQLRGNDFDIIARGEVRIERDCSSQNRFMQTHLQTNKKLICLGGLLTEEQAKKYSCKNVKVGVKVID